MSTNENRQPHDTCANQRPLAVVGSGAGGQLTDAQRIAELWSANVSVSQRNRQLRIGNARLRRLLGMKGVR